MRTKRMAVLTGFFFAAACAGIAIPEPVKPNVPREKIEPTSLKFRIAVFDFVDQTGMAGGVTQTGSVRGLLKSGQYIISPPDVTFSSGGGASVEVSAKVDGAGSREGAPSVAGPGRDSRPSGIPYVPIPGGGAVQSIPDAFSSVLFDSGRFDLYDVGQLKNRTLADTDKTLVVLKQMYAAWSARLKAEGQQKIELDRYSFPDAVLTGAITSIDAKEMTLDVRLINFASDDVMFATSALVKVTNAGSELKLDRDDLRKLAQKLIGALPSPHDLKKAQIVQREGEIVTLNVGREDRIIKGMNAFVVTYGDKVVDPSTGDTLGDETFLGELFVFSVYPRTAKARIFNNAPAVRVGDYVIFK